MEYKNAARRTRRRSTALFLLGGLLFGSACSGNPPPAAVNSPGPTVVQVPAQEPFSISLVATVPVPIQVGTHLGFRLSSSTAGYASLYLIDPLGRVSVLTENLPLAAGSIEYPLPAQGFTLAASQPVGVNRVILLVTRQPFDGFSGEATLTSPVSLAVNGSGFVSQLGRATASMRRDSWVTDEIQVRVVG